MAEKLYIMPHQGLGDHILCSGIYRTLSRNYDLTVIPVFKKNHKALEKLLRDEKKIEVVSYGNWMPTMEPHRDFLKKIGYKILNLGGFAGGNIPNGLRFDAWFYQQAKVPFSARWDAFNYERDIQKENALFKKIVPSRGKYIFVHEDPSRGYTLDRHIIPKKFEIVSAEPALRRQYTPFDYYKILENAEEIHCIESSFGAFIESIKISSPKFAHRYARPEAKSDYRQEFTYKTDWKIL